MNTGIKIIAWVQSVADKEKLEELKVACVCSEEVMSERFKSMLFKLVKYRVIGG